MSSLKIVLAATAATALCAITAFADPAPQGAPQVPTQAWHRPDPQQMAAWHAQMCKDRYAHEAGRLAYLQAALSLSDAQKGAFDQWRDEKLAAAKSRSDACATHTPDARHGEHDALERNARVEKMLETKLAELKSERPALEALYQSLTPEQKKVFDRAGGGFGHHHGHHFGGPMGEHHHMNLDGAMVHAPSGM